MKIYIAGPMTGYEDWNFPAFNEAEKDLVSQGYKVINPAKLADHTDRPWAWYIRNSLIHMLEQCDKIYLLEGWQKSRGASLELFLACLLDFKIYIEERYDGDKVYIQPSCKESMMQELDYDLLFGDSKEEEETVLPMLIEAYSLVRGTRQNAYGHPHDDFSRTAKIWSAILGTEVTAEQVGLCMIGVKISRQCNAHKRDNLVDIAGYAETINMIKEWEEQHGKDLQKR